MPLRCARRYFPDHSTTSRRTSAGVMDPSARSPNVGVRCTRTIVSSRAIRRGSLARFREPCRRPRSECHARRPPVNPDTVHEIGLDGPAITLPRRDGARTNAAFPCHQALGIERHIESRPSSFVASSGAPRLPSPTRTLRAPVNLLAGARRTTAARQRARVGNGQCGQSRAGPQQ